MASHSRMYGKPFEQNNNRRGGPKCPPLNGELPKGVKIPAQGRDNKLGGRDGKLGGGMNNGAGGEDFST